MSLSDLTTEKAVLSELGRRLSRHRIAHDWTQAELAERAGVGQATVQRVERGSSVQTTSLVKLLRALELLEALDAALPASLELPIAQWEREQRKQRRRVRHAQQDAAAAPGATPAAPSQAPSPPPAEDAAREPAERRWQWGDERGAGE